MSETTTREYIVLLRKDGIYNQFRVTAPNVDEALKYADFDMAIPGPSNTQLLLLYSEPTRKPDDFTEYRYIICLNKNGTTCQNSIVATDIISALKQCGFDICVNGKVDTLLHAVYREDKVPPTIINTSKEASNATDTQTA